MTALSALPRTPPRHRWFTRRWAQWQLQRHGGWVTDSTDPNRWWEASLGEATRWAQWRRGLESLAHPTAAQAQAVFEAVWTHLLRPLDDEGWRHTPAFVQEALAVADLAWRWGASVDAPLGLPGAEKESPLVALLHPHRAVVPASGALRAVGVRWLLARGAAVTVTEGAPLTERALLMGQPNAARLLHEAGETAPFSSSFWTQWLPKLYAAVSDWEDADAIVTEAVPLLQQLGARVDANAPLAQGTGEAVHPLGLAPTLTAANGLLALGAQPTAILTRQGDTLAHQAWARGWPLDDPRLMAVWRAHPQLLTTPNHAGVPPLFQVWQSTAHPTHAHNLAWAQQQPWAAAQWAARTHANDTFLSWGAVGLYRTHLPLAVPALHPWIPAEQWLDADGQAAQRFTEADQSILYRCYHAPEAAKALAMVLESTASSPMQASRPRL